MTHTLETPPLYLIRSAISSAICRRTNELLRKCDAGEITHQAYIAEVFPADAISYLDEAINECIRQYNESLSEARDEVL